MFFPWILILSRLSQFYLIYVVLALLSCATLNLASFVKNCPIEQKKHFALSSPLCFGGLLALSPHLTVLFFVSFILLPSLYCPLLPQTAEGASNVASTFVSPISSFLPCLHLPRLFSILLSTSLLSRSFSPSFPPRSVALPPSLLPPSCTGAVFLPLFLCLLSQRAQVCARACLVVFFLSLTDTSPHHTAEPLALM